MSPPNTSTNLSPNSHVISSRDTTIPSSSKASSSSNTLTKVKLRRKGIDHHEINPNEPSSPYYKGLLYQHITINDEHGSQNQYHQHNHLNNDYRVSTTTSEGPYYKGLLTNFSLGIHGGQDHLQSEHDYNWRIHEVEGAYYECSPYFKGLLTYSSLAMCGHGGVVPIVGLSSFAFNMNFCLGGKTDSSNEDITPSVTSFGGQGTLSSLITNEDIIARMDSERQPALSYLSPPAPIPLPSPSLPLPPLPPPPLPMLPSIGDERTASNMELKVEDGKPLGGRESEETEEEKAADMIANNKEEEEAMNVSDLPDEEVKKKSLRESVYNISEQTMSTSSSSESSNNEDVHQQIKEEEDGSYLKKYVWADKYQPKLLRKFICHKHIVSQLITMVEDGCVCDHFIFEGPPGVGKRTMIRALLRQVFGQDEVRVTKEERTFLLKGEMIESIQVPLTKSKHHVEVNLSQTKDYNEQVVADLLRETYDKIIKNSMPCKPKNCQAIIIYEAERLSTESLLYVKWMIERYNNGCNKVFFCCSDESKLQIVKPLCKTFRLSPPSTQEIVEVLDYIRKEEGKELTLEFLTKVVEKSKNNLRQAIRSLEATCQNKDSIKDEELILTGWEDDISSIAKNILKEQSSKQLYEIHVKLQSLIIHKVSPDFVYNYLISELKSLVDESLKQGLEKLKREHNQNFYGIKMRSGKHSSHPNSKERKSDESNNETPKKNARSYSEVEEFIAKFMSWYKSSSARSDTTK